MITTQSQADAHNLRVLVDKMKKIKQSDIPKPAWEDAPDDPAASITAPPARFDDTDDHFCGKESELHRQIEEELKKRRWYYVHSRTDQRTTQQKGVPDFIIFAEKSKVFACEIKIKGGKLSHEQNIAKHCLLALGHKYKTIYSLQGFIDFIEGKEERQADA